MLEITFTYASTNKSHLQFGFSCYTVMTQKNVYIPWEREHSKALCWPVTILLSSFCYSMPLTWSKTHCLWSVWGVLPHGYYIPRLAFFCVPFGLNMTVIIFSWSDLPVWILFPLGCHSYALPMFIHICLKPWIVCQK